MRFAKVGAVDAAEDKKAVKAFLNLCYCSSKAHSERGNHYSRQQCGPLYNSSSSSCAKKEGSISLSKGYVVIIYVYDYCCKKKKLCVRVAFVCGHMWLSISLFRHGMPHVWFHVRCGQCQMRWNNLLLLGMETTSMVHYQCVVMVSSRI